jgi:hypothetical protein
MSLLGLVSRVTPVHTAKRMALRGEGHRSPCVDPRQPPRSSSRRYQSWHSCATSASEWRQRSRRQLPKHSNCARKFAGRSMLMPLSSLFLLPGQVADTILYFQPPLESVFNFRPGGVRRGLCFFDRAPGREIFVFNAMAARAAPRQTLACGSAAGPAPRRTVHFVSRQPPALAIKKAV